MLRQARASAARRGDQVAREELSELPATRGDCLAAGSARVGPCCVIRCPYHLALDVDKVTGTIRINAPFHRDEHGVPVIDLAAMPATCALDVADGGGVGIDVVAAALGVTRERARQIELEGLRKLRGDAVVSELADDEPRPAEVAT